VARSGRAFENERFKIKNINLSGEKKVKPDLYTKVILTVIALALVVIAGEKIITDAHAQNRPTKVVICDSYGSKCAGIDGYNDSGALYIRSK
jgi:hypothetical protein